MSLKDAGGDDALTGEERIQWLRERGIEINIPGEKKAKSETVFDATQTHSVTIVKIPHDESIPYQEISLDLQKTSPGDLFLDVLKIYFSSTQSSLDLEALKATAARQFGNEDIHVAPSTLDKLASAGSVEAFVLAQPCEANNYTCISLYLDEVGQLKHLPPNNRAKTLANLCGFKDVPLVGNMFVGKTKGLIEFTRQNVTNVLNLSYMAIFCCL